jgi:hypothetical protein
MLDPCIGVSVPAAGTHGKYGSLGGPARQSIPFLFGHGWPLLRHTTW